MFDEVCLTICCFALSVIVKNIISALEFTAQFRKPAKEVFEIYTKEENEKACKYQQAKMKFSIFSCTMNFLKDAFMIYKINCFYTCLEKYEQFISRDISLFLVFSLVDSLFNIPLHIYYDFVLEDSFGFNKKTMGTFIYDFFAMNLINLILMTPLLKVIIYCISNFKNFYIFVGTSVILFELFVILIYPNFIAPIFNKFEKMDETSDLYKNVCLLAKKVNFNVQSILVMDGSKRSAHSNAYFIGFGKNKKIVFYDTLLNQSKSDQQILAVLCHEFGHFVHSHIWKSMFLHSIMIFSKLYIFNLMFHSMDGPISVKILNFSTLISPLMLITTLLFNVFSRKNEKEADMFALEFGYGEHLLQALKTLAKTNSSTLTHNYLYSLIKHSHPPVIERIGIIKAEIAERAKKEK
ncbi:hypothetical protein NUSPORA_00292 [Nucleospora cyclopteri]